MCWRSCGFRVCTTMPVLTAHPAQQRVPLVGSLKKRRKSPIFEVSIIVFRTPVTPQSAAGLGLRAPLLAPLGYWGVSEHRGCPSWGSR